MTGQVLLQRASLLRVQGVRAEAGRPMRPHHAFRDRAVDVGELKRVIAGAGQEPGNQGANLACAENEYAMHGAPPKTPHYRLSAPGTPVRGRIAARRAW